MQTAIVYDWLDSRGGIERVIPQIIKIFKNADLYTSYYDHKNAHWASNYVVKTSFINKFPGFIKKSRILSLLFYPYAFESFSFNDYDLVISVTSSFSKAIITKPQTKHICYMLTPTRYFWIDKESYFKNFIIKSIGNFLLPKLKKWDLIASKRPDAIISISNFVKNRVKKYYKNPSYVIYPPFDIAYWSNIKNTINSNEMDKQRFYLLVSRLEPYKKVELAIKVFNKLNEKLLIVGTGSQYKNLKSQASKNINFKKNISDKDLALLYTKAEALIMPQAEEFGMVSLEAQFFGCPVISYRLSGTTENILENKTGIFFDKQTPEALSEAIVRYRSLSYNLKKSSQILGPKNSKRFDKKIFIYNLRRFINL